MHVVRSVDYHISLVVQLSMLANRGPACAANVYEKACVILLTGFTKLTSQRLILMENQKNDDLRMLYIYIVIHC